MAIDVTVTNTIARPPEAVAAYLADPRNDPEWIGGLVEVVPPSGPIAAGTQVKRIAKFMGRRIHYVLEVEHHEPGRLLRMRSVEAPFPMRVTYEVTPADGGSRVALRVEGGPGGLARLVHPLMAIEVGRNLRGDLRRLRARLER
ncbi:MAG: SRPBCC family protein [Dehalococcoidia bacterium]